MGGRGEKSDKFDRRAGLTRLPIPLLLQSGLDGEPKAAKAERGEEEEEGGGGITRSASTLSPARLRERARLDGPASTSGLGGEGKNKIIIINKKKILKIRQ